MKYNTVRSDYLFLIKIGRPYDITGGWDEGYNLDLLLKNPTEETAKDITVDFIEYWFEKGLENDQRISYEEIENKYPRVKQIKKRYNISCVWIPKSRRDPHGGIV